MKDKQKYLAMHEGKIYTDNKGRYNTYVPDANNKYGRKLIRKNTKEELEDSIVKFYKDYQYNPNIRDVFVDWSNSKLEYGEITKSTYDRYQNDFNRFFSDIQDMKFCDISELWLEERIKRTIHDMELTSKSYSNMRTLVYGMFKYGKKRGYTDISVTQFFGDLDVSKRSFRRRRFTDEESVFTDRELEMLEEYIYSKSNSIIRLGILFDMYTGLRAGELSTLKYSDFDGSVMTVQRTETHNKDEDGTIVYSVEEFTKGRDGIRKVILPPRAESILKRIRLLNPVDGYVFVLDGRRIKADTFSKTLRRMCDQIGIKPRSMHKIRKTYATKLINAGLEESLIIKQMGHTDFSTTKQFYYFDNHDIEEKQEKIKNALSMI